MDPADSDSESRDEITATWAESQLEEAYNRNELQSFLAKNPVMKSLLPGMTGLMNGPVASSPEATNKLDTAKATLRLLKEDGITVGSCKAHDLFDLGLEVMQTALLELFERPRVLVGESPVLTEPSVKAAQPPNSVSATPAPARKVQAVVAAIQSDSDSESGLSGSGSDGDLRRIHLAAAESEAPAQTPAPQDPDRATPDQVSPPQKPGYYQRPSHVRTTFQQCSHCGPHRHDVLHYWKRLKCQRYGKERHPSDWCLFVYRGCGEIHDIGKCQMEVFYNLIRQWNNPANHGSVLPESSEMMLN
ncbi:hypothetical protein PC110_g11331 [Phytophthora cactorum]|uniref:Uncharacterized protein n=1 Tax=Phytophthora cactorum TaxID=29920 RepID=A0A329S5W9_9STRA|nr:hypothetical protein PC110_g11331 [Phytophthora cactorum]